MKQKTRKAKPKKRKRTRSSRSLDGVGRWSEEKLQKHIYKACENWRKNIFAPDLEKNSEWQRDLAKHCLTVVADKAFAAGMEAGLLLAIGTPSTDTR
jgi:hypothetical protein